MLNHCDYCEELLLKKTQASRLYCTLSTPTYSRWNRFTCTYVCDLQEVNKSSEWWEAINRQLTSLIPFIFSYLYHVSFFKRTLLFTENISNSEETCGLESIHQSHHTFQRNMDTPSSWINSTRHEKRHHPQTRVISKRQRSRPVALSRSSTTGLTGKTSQ